MTSVGQTRFFQIRVDAATQANSIQYYNTKLDTGYYHVKLVGVSNVMDPSSNVEFQLVSSTLLNSYGTEPYFTYQAYTGSYVPSVPVQTHYDFGTINLQSQILDIWIVDRATGLPHADFQYCTLTFEVEKLA